MTDFHSAKVGVCLTSTNEDDRLASDIGHAKRCSNLQKVLVSESNRNTAVPLLASLTLSSMMSIFVKIIPSIPLAFALLTPEKSFKDRLNLVSWSTASLPVTASPTKKILSGWFTETSYTQEVIQLE
jgi:hypothetical protein